MIDTETLRLAGRIETQWRFGVLWYSHWETLAKHARVWTALFGDLSA